MSCFLISLAISSLILPIIIFVARKFDITDKPDDRKHHKQPTPLLGGLGIFISFTITMLICVEHTVDVLRLLVYSGIMVLIGTIDDIRDIRAIYKLSMEIISATIITLLGVRISIGSFFGWKGVWIYSMEIMVSVIWIVGITNAVNIIDGLDGLAGGISLIAGIAFAIIFMIYDYALLNQVSIILLGGILGFLIYNFHPSKLFMGDGGSLFIGFLLSVLSILYINTQKGSAAIWVPIIILAVPIFETGSSILRRALKGRSAIKADDGHLHNKLIEKGYSPIAAVSIIYAWAILAGILGIMIAIANLSSLALFIIILLIAIGVKICI